MKKSSVQMKMRTKVVNLHTYGSDGLSASPFASPHTGAVELSPISIAANGKPDAAHDQKVVARVEAKERLNISGIYLKKLVRGRGD